MYLYIWWSDGYFCLKMLDFRKYASCEHLQQMLTVMVTFVQATYMSRRHLSISSISQLLLTQFWPNFIGSVPGTICNRCQIQGEICPSNICPSDICPHQEYGSCYWPNFDQTLMIGSLDNLQQMPTVMVTFFLAIICPGDICQATFVLVTIIHMRNISAVTDPILTKL